MKLKYVAIAIAFMCGCGGEPAQLNEGRTPLLEPNGETTAHKQLAYNAIDGSWPNGAPCPATSLSKVSAKVRIVVPAGAETPIVLAANDLLRDMNNVMGQNAVEIATSPDPQRPSIIIANGDYGGVAAPAGTEAHQMAAYGPLNHVLLQGADARGTAYAIYTFSEQILKIPPLWYWAYGNPAGYFPVGTPPAPQPTINLGPGFCRTVAPPTTKYRGFFINDPELFNRWAKLYTPERPPRIALYLETAMRLKLNVVHGLALAETKIDPDDRTDAANDVFQVHKRGLIYVRDWGSNGSYANWRLKQVPSITEEDLPLELGSDPMCSNRAGSMLVKFWTQSMDATAKDNATPQNLVKPIYTAESTLWYLGIRAFRDGKVLWNDLAQEGSSWTHRANFQIAAIQCQRQLLHEKFGTSGKMAVHLWSDLEDLYLASGTFRDAFRSGKALDNLVLTYANHVRTQVPARSATDNWGNFGVETDEYTGYYQNLQFTSSGSHIVDAIGPWMAAASFKYVQGRAGAPLRYGMVNIGNFREFLLSASVLADLLWDIGAYDVDAGVAEVIESYFPGKGAVLRDLYRDYLNAYWRQAPTPTSQPFDPPIDRHWVWTDLRQYSSSWALLEDLYDDDHLGTLMRDDDSKDNGTYDNDDLDSSWSSDKSFYGIALTPGASTETHAIYRGLSMSSSEQGAIYAWREVLNRPGGLMAVKPTLTTNPLLFQSFFETPIRAVIESARVNYFIALARREARLGNHAAAVSYLNDDAFQATQNLDSELDEVEFGEFAGWHDPPGEAGKGWNTYKIRMKILCVLCNSHLAACNGTLSDCDWVFDDDN